MNRTEGPVIWSARALWLTLAVTGRTYTSALDSAPDAVSLVAAVALFTLWGVVLLALLVPSTVSLTVVRLLAPLAPVTAIVALVAGSDTAVAVAGAGLGLAVTVVVSSADFGAPFVQASAYGDERRLPLRPPGVLVPVIVAMWCVVATATITGPLVWADGSPAAGVPLTALAVAGAWLVGTRSHQLARRWLVVVPAGLVVHDRFVLADTLMVPRARVASMALALADTEAADLTGGALGHSIEVGLVDHETVVLAPDRDHPGGRALHVLSMLVSPSRPGRALAAWSGRDA